VKHERLEEYYDAQVQSWGTSSEVVARYGTQEEADALVKRLEAADWSKIYQVFPTDLSDEPLPTGAPVS
jgi:hypothetical protein